MHVVVNIGGRAGEPQLIGETIPLPAHFRALAGQAVGSPAIAFGTSRTARHGYFATLRIAGIVETADGIALRIDRLRYFRHIVPIARDDTPYESVLASRGAAARRGLLAQAIRMLPPVDFATILGVGEPELTTHHSVAAAGGLAEPGQSSFAVPARARERTPFEREVLTQYGWSCALTHQSEAYAGTPDELVIVPIRPPENGGPQTIANHFPALPAPARTFERGHLTLGSELELIVVLDRLDPEVLTSLNPIGRLSSPSDAAARPDPDALEWHRSVVFNRHRR